ncbi:hypothetical protein [Ornithinibacillus halotolerans]|uniref:Uncharacterized protein n=1 Tax=Ornithinibacillus halotolerans TaxID=1274357 RepID=A0A916RKY9_9BACI|nr:hypothetical protein [Ornithinibacillus halotolerans]GGA60523.1 hypothetical protein GCM10008025_00680 [Ornithinibacillus halotolerans]
MRMIDFLFHEQKYKVEKFVIVIGTLFITMLLIPLGFPFVVNVIYVPVLSILFIVSILKILCYNRKNNIKTKIIEKIETIFIAVFIGVFLYFV